MVWVRDCDCSLDSTPCREEKSTWPTPVRARSFAQAWHQSGKVAWLGACVELCAQQLFPRGAAGRCGTRQAEHELVVGETCECARLQRRGADLVERQYAEHLAEAGHFLVEQRPDCFRCGIAPGEAGAAGHQ